jgi:hypothetical protein
MAFISCEGVPEWHVDAIVVVAMNAIKIQLMN